MAQRRRRRRLRRWRVNGMVVTPEVVQAVHEQECTARGHDLNTVVDYGTGHPVRIVCGHCDLSWPVGAVVAPDRPGALARAVCRSAEMP